MYALTTLRALRNTLLALALAASSSLAAASTIRVSINTATGFGAAGWLDMQFNAAGADTPQLAHVRASHFSGFDPAALVELNGDVSGSLASGYLFSNAPGWNDLFHAVTYGGVLAFDLTFDGAAEQDNQIGQSLFSIAAYAEDKTTLVGNYGADGSLINLAWTPANPSSGSTGGVVVDINDPVAVTAVPEPSDWLLSGTGLALMALVLRRRRATAGRGQQSMALAA